MFTGIVEELGTVREIRPHGAGARISIDAATVLSDATLGASIAVNGCCLTVTEFDSTYFSADAVPETLDRTGLGQLAPGDAVNLERPLAANGRYGGHVVQGHIDGVTTISAIEALDDGSFRYSFELPAALAHYVVEKGSIAVDGISLTVAALGAGTFDIAVIPHTCGATNLGSRRPGQQVNIEVDILAKYVERMILTGKAA